MTETCLEYAHLLTAKHLKFDGFSIRLIEQDSGEWMAYLIELPTVSAFGNSPDQAISELKIAWEAMKESYRKHGEEIPKPKQEK